MKIIDLLNKIANGEEVPKKIKYNGTIYEKFDYNNKYYDVENNTREEDILSEHLASESFYNDEVKVIEDNKKIEKISWKEKESLAGFIRNNNDKLDILARRTEKLKKSLNEIIDKLNKEEERC